MTRTEKLTDFFTKKTNTLDLNTIKSVWTPEEAVYVSTADFKCPCSRPHITNTVNIRNQETNEIVQIGIDCCMKFFGFDMRKHVRQLNKQRKAYKLSITARTSPAADRSHEVEELIIKLAVKTKFFTHLQMETFLKNKRISEKQYAYYLLLRQMSINRSQALKTGTNCIIFTPYAIKFLKDMHSKLTRHITDIKHLAL